MSVFGLNSYIIIMKAECPEYYVSIWSEFLTSLESPEYDRIITSYSQCIFKHIIIGDGKMFCFSIMFI